MAVSFTKRGDSEPRASDAADQTGAGGAQPIALTSAPAEKFQDIETGAACYFEPTPEVIDAFDRLDARPALAALRGVKPSEIAALLREYRYLRDESPREDMSSGCCPEVMAWQQEVSRVLGDDFSLDDAFLHHEYVPERNRLLAWSCAVQIAAVKRTAVQDDQIRELDKVAQELMPGQHLFHSEFVDAALAAANFFKVTLQKAKELDSLPALSFTAISRHLMNDASYGAEVREWLEKAYQVAQWGADQQRFSALTRIAATVAEKGEGPDVVQAALLSYLTPDRIAMMKSGTGFGPLSSKTARYISALHTLLEEEFITPLPRDSSLPSYSWHHDSNRFLQLVDEVARKQKVDGLSLFVLWAAHERQAIASESPDVDEKLRQHHYNRVIMLVAPTAERLGLRRLNNDLLEFSFRLRHPDQYVATRCGMCEVLGMKQSSVATFMEQAVSKLEGYLLAQGLRQEDFRISCRSKNPQSVFEKAEFKGMSAGLSLQESIAEQTDLIGFEVRFRDAMVFEMMRDELYGAIGDMFSPDRWDTAAGAQRQLVSVSHGERKVVSELQIKYGLKPENSHRDQHVPHFWYKSDRRFRLHQARSSSGEKSELNEMPGVAFDHIDDPPTGNRHADFQAITARLSQFSYVRIVDRSSGRNPDGPDCSIVKLPAKSIVADALAARYGHRFREHVLLRRENGRERPLKPHEELLKGETLYARLATRQESAVYFSKRELRKITGNISSLNGQLHLLHPRAGAKEFREAGRRLLAEIFGPEDRWLRENVYEPFRHWRWLSDVDQLFEVIGRQGAGGVRLLDPQELRAWYDKRYVKFESSKFDPDAVDPDLIKVSIDEDQYGILHELTRVAVDLKVPLAEIGTVKPEDGFEATVLIRLDRDYPGSSIEEFADKAQALLERTGRIRLRRGKYPPEPFGIEHRVTALLDGRDGSISSLTEKLRESRINVRLLHVADAAWKKGSAAGHHPLEMEISGPGSRNNLRDLANREEFKASLKNLLGGPGSSDNGADPLCVDITITNL